MTATEIALAAGGIAFLMVLHRLAWLGTKAGGRLITIRPKGTGTRPAHLPSWLARRCRRDRFEGAILSLFVLTGLVALVVLAALAIEVWRVGEPTGLDARVSSALEGYRYPVLVLAFSWITELGDNATLFALLGIASGFLWVQGRRGDIALIWATGGGAKATTWLIKIAIDRPRPEFLFDVIAHSPSFPSGHATGAIAVYGILAYVLARDGASHRQRFEIIYWSAVLIVLIALSRLYVSVHFTSDVLAGLMVGGVWLLGGIAAAELSREGALPPGRQGRPEED